MGTCLPGGEVDLSSCVLGSADLEAVGVARCGQDDPAVGEARRPLDLQAGDSKQCPAPWGSHPHPTGCCIREFVCPGKQGVERAGQEPTRAQGGLTIAGEMRVPAEPQGKEQKCLCELPATQNDEKNKSQRRGTEKFNPRVAVGPRGLPARLHVHHQPRRAAPGAAPAAHSHWCQRSGLGEHTFGDKAGLVLSPCLAQGAGSALLPFSQGSVNRR